MDGKSALDFYKEYLDEQTALTGFYSYSGMCPFTCGVQSELHNQTMTITVLSEQ